MSDERLPGDPFVPPMNPLVPLDDAGMRRVSDASCLWAALTEMAEKDLGNALAALSVLTERDLRAMVEEKLLFTRWKFDIHRDGSVSWDRCDDEPPH
jgi:hypothetical protein